jgi:hypothetical protein
MIKAFKIFKQGMTNKWVTILIPESNFNDTVLFKKVSFYLSLGYKVEII